MARRRSNQAKWMKNPRIVRWDLADAAYEANRELDKKHFRGDLRNPREVVEEKIKKMRFDSSEAGLRLRYQAIVARGLRGD